MIPSITSLGPTPFGRAPFTSTFIVFGFSIANVWVAKTCSTSDVPIPNANAPNAPWVAVWLSPQTIVIPGCVIPCSGPITCTMPCLGSLTPNKVTPNSLQLFSNASICFFDNGSFIPRLLFEVGTP